MFVSEVRVGHMEQAAVFSEKRVLRYGRSATVSDGRTRVFLFPGAEEVLILFVNGIAQPPEDVTIDRERVVLAKAPRGGEIVTALLLEE